jgi:RNA polymerase sigma-70 factor, ECF subfamily
VSTSRVTDAELVAQAQQGDQAAFGELVDRHRRAVFRAAMAALGSHGEAEDAAQEACILAWTRLGSFRGAASFRTWLLAIAWHQAINRRRSLLSWWRRTVPFADEPGDPAHETGSRLSVIEGRMNLVAGSKTSGRNPEQLASGDELRRDIARAIGKLSPKLRDTLLLAQSGEYSYEEVGAMLGAPTGTIKWRVAEARRLIRKQLQARGHVELG